MAGFILVRVGLLRLQYRLYGLFEFGWGHSRTPRRRQVYSVSRGFTLALVGLILRMDLLGHT